MPIFTRSGRDKMFLLSLMSSVIKPQINSGLVLWCLTPRSTLFRAHLRATRSFHTPLRLNSSAICYTKVNDSFSLDYLDKWIRLWLFLFRGSSMMWSPSLILIGHCAYRKCNLRTINLISFKLIQRQEVHLQVKGTQKYKQTMLDNFVI
jgi:hypothetical protein